MLAGVRAFAQRVATLCSASAKHHTINNANASNAGGTGSALNNPGGASSALTNPSLHKQCPILPPPLQTNGSVQDAALF